MTQDASRTVNRGEVARLLGVPQLQVWWWARQRGLKPGADSRWPLDEVYEWALANGLESRVPLRHWPTPARPAQFLGAWHLPKSVALRFSVEQRVIALVWELAVPFDSDVEPPPHGRAEELPPGDMVIRVGRGFAGMGAELHWQRRDMSLARLTPGWGELARALGRPVPFWPSALRTRSLIGEWESGVEGVVAAATPSQDVTPLLQLAAVLPDEDPGRRVLLHLARTDLARASAEAADDVRLQRDLSEADTTVYAAVPLEVPAPPELDEHLMRLGWRTILDRSDTLAEQCIHLARMWDGGKRLPFAQPDSIDPHAGRWAAEWAARLVPAPRRTAIYRSLGRDMLSSGEALVDPETDAPVLRDEDGMLWTAHPQRLPAAMPLAEVILSGPIWIRTQDGVLYPAPRDAYFGLSWGYHGSGPTALAKLVHVLLDDITAQAPHTLADAPRNLERLMEHKLADGTVLTRQTLLAALAGTWFPGDDDEEDEL